MNFTEPWNFNKVMWATAYYPLHGFSFVWRQNLLYLVHNMFQCLWICPHSNSVTSVFLQYRFLKRKILVPSMFQEGTFYVIATIKNNELNGMFNWHSNYTVYTLRTLTLHCQRVALWQAARSNGKDPDFKWWSWVWILFCSVL